MSWNRSSLEPRSSLVEYPRRGGGKLSGRLVRNTSSDRNVGRRSHALSRSGSEDKHSQRTMRPSPNMDEQRVWITPEGVPIAPPPLVFLIAPSIHSHLALPCVAALEKSIKDNWLADRRAEWERCLAKRRLQHEAMSAARDVIDEKQVPNAPFCCLACCPPPCRALLLAPSPPRATGSRLT